MQALCRRNSIFFAQRQQMTLGLCATAQQVETKPAAQPSGGASQEAMAALQALSKDMTGQATKEETGLAALAKNLMSDPETAEQFRYARAEAKQPVKDIQWKLHGFSQGFSLV
jgi:hypothetical protein